MTIEDLIKIYETKKEKYGEQAYRYISNVFKEAKEQHKRDFTGNDQEQSWQAFQGKNFEKMIAHIIAGEVRDLGLEIVNGNTLKRTNESNLSKDMAQVKRSLLIEYGEFGYHLPDVDIIIYKPKTNKAIAVISTKVTLQEKIAQTRYWRIKLQNHKLTKHIKVYFVTSDEDGTLIIKEATKKGQATAEIDTDGNYFLSETNIEKSDKVKMFDEFIDDLKVLLNNKTF